MEENTQQPQKKGMPIGIIVVVLVIILAVAGVVYSSNNKTQNATKEQQVTENTNKTPTSPAASNTTTNSSYKDGTYDATGEYQSPGGAESLDVKLTLKDGVITDANVISNAERPISKKMQAQFISGYKAEVVGKNIDEVNLGPVSGSSLSPKGFNDAVAKIKQQAQA